MKILKILTYTTILLIILFYLVYIWTSDFSAWDTPGHFFAANYYKEYLWPSFTGWNHLVAGGYPQGYFYPSLFHWLVGGLGKLIGIAFSFKIFLSLLIILLPISFWIFLKTHKFKEENFLLALIWIFIILNIPKQDIGGDFYSVFRIGLVTFQFALPFYFLYLSVLKKGIENLNNLLIAAIFLSIIILSHAFVAIAALISSLFYFCGEIPSTQALSARMKAAERTCPKGYPAPWGGVVHFLFFYLKKRLWKTYILHLILTFLITAFWWAPFVYFNEYIIGIEVGRSITLHPLFFIIFFLVLFLLLFQKKSRPYLNPILILFISFLMFFILEQYVFLRISKEFPLHAYRFLIFVYILSAILISHIFDFLKIKRLGLVVSLILLILSFVYLQSDIFYFQKRDVELPIFNNEQLTGLVPSETSGVDPLFNTLAPHVLSHNLLFQKNKLLNGLFVESAINSKAILSLMHEVYENPFTWGINYYQPNKDLVLRHLDYLGVCWTLSYYELSSEKLKDFKTDALKTKFTINQTSFEKDLFLYKFPCSLTEIITLPQNFNNEKEWDKKINEWWSSETQIKNVIILAEDNAPVLKEDYKLDPGAKILLIDSKPNYYKLKIEAETPQFVYIKIPYFPNWHAYQNNKEIKIYRASPNMMVIKAKGDLELKFVKSKIEKISNFISLFGILLLLIFLLGGKVKKVIHRNKFLTSFQGLFKI